MNNGIIKILGGAGFLPSTVCTRFVDVNFLSAIEDWPEMAQAVGLPILLTIVRDVGQLWMARISKPKPMNDDLH